MAAAHRVGSSVRRMEVAYCPLPFEASCYPRPIAATDYFEVDLAVIDWRSAHSCFGDQNSVVHQPFAGTAFRRASTADWTADSVSRLAIRPIVASCHSVAKPTVVNQIGASRFELNHQPDCSPFDWHRLEANRFGACQQEFGPTANLDWYRRDFDLPFVQGSSRLAEVARLVEYPS